jgi:hypothetical protein
MALQGIAGATRATKRFTTKADPAAVRAPDLVNRDFTANRPDGLWVADFTYSAQFPIMCSGKAMGLPSRRLAVAEATHNQRPSRKPSRRSRGRNRAGAGFKSLKRARVASLVARSASRY